MPTLKKMIFIFMLLMFFIGCTAKQVPQHKKPEPSIPTIPLHKTQKPPKHQTQKQQSQTPSASEIEIKINGKWEQLNGLTGGDMHFLYKTSNNVLFLSHGFSGVWRSEDGGESWSMIKQEDFVDVHFYDMVEFGDKLYAGSNKVLWCSEDEGKSWTKFSTVPEVDYG